MCRTRLSCATLVVPLCIPLQGISLDDIQNTYWVDELRAFCKDHNLKVCFALCTKAEYARLHPSWGNWSSRHARSTGTALRRIFRSVAARRANSTGSFSSSSTVAMSPQANKSGSQAPWICQGTRSLSPVLFKYAILSHLDRLRWATQVCNST